MRILENEPLSKHTTFHIGGNARYFICVKNEDELRQALDFVKEQKADHLIIGGGSNLLVADWGFDGVVIKIAFDEINIDGTRVTVGAGVPFATLVEKTIKADLCGLEKASGLPGTVGGAIYGDAGCFGWETRNNISYVKVLHKQDIHILDRNKCEFKYRSSVFKEKAGEYIILEATFDLGEITDKNRNEIKLAIIKCLDYRRVNQAVQSYCAGSFFQNVLLSELPLHKQKEFAEVARDGKIAAGYFIDQAGLKGKQIGGAQVSMKHANFLINANNATAEDVIMLASLVKQYVRREFNIQLKEEVQMVGF